jgi:hypothetical protein
MFDSQPAKITVEVSNILTGEITIFPSLHRAAVAMCCSEPNVINRFHGSSDSLIKGVYKVKSIVTESFSPRESYKHSIEIREKMSEFQKNRFNSLESRNTLMDSSPTKKGIEVTDLETGNTKIYTSIRQASRELGLYSAAISKYLKSNPQHPFKGRYKIVICP